MKRGFLLLAKVPITIALLFTQLLLFAQKDTRPNVLLIAVDDLNDWIGMGFHKCVHQHKKMFFYPFNVMSM
jgi:hypothetical protein